MLAAFSCRAAVFDIRQRGAYEFTIHQSHSFINKRAQERRPVDCLFLDCLDAGTLVSQCNIQIITNRT
jgi:hypothetical protein